MTDAKSHVVEPKSRERRRLQILFLTSVLPSQQKGGGEIVSQRFLDGLRSLGCTVTAIGYARPGEGQRSVADEECVEERPIETAYAGRWNFIWAMQSLWAR